MKGRSQNRVVRVSEERVTTPLAAELEAQTGSSNILGGFCIEQVWERCLRSPSDVRSDVEVWRSGGALQARRYGGMGAWRSGGVQTRREYRVLEERCRRVDVEVWSSGALELWRRAEAWRRRGMDRRRCGAGVKIVEAWRALEL